MMTDPGCFPPTSVYPGPYTNPTALPLGEWHVMANGCIYQLTLSAVSGSSVTAALRSGDITTAPWDAATLKMTFIRSLPALGLKQEFTGYLFQYSDGNDPKGQMAGVFGNVKVGLESGWYATQPRRS